MVDKDKINIPLRWYKGEKAKMNKVTQREHLKNMYNYKILLKHS